MNTCIGGDCPECGGQYEHHSFCSKHTTKQVDSDSLNLDVSAEHARALHRVVRAMHDGHCPRCGCIGAAESFVNYENAWQRGHKCPSCHFAITEDEAHAALMAFQPHMQKSLEVFETWRQRRPEKPTPRPANERINER